MIGRGIARSRVARPRLFAHPVGRHPMLAVGLVLIGAMLGAALVAPLGLAVDPDAQDILARLERPGPGHWAGTDQFGRDVLARVLHGCRQSLAIAAASVVFALGVGGTIGVGAAAAGGWVDRLAMRVMDVVFAFPIVLLAIGIVAMLGAGDRTTALALGIVYVPIFARMLRGPALVLLRSDFVRGARAIGAGPVAILVRHVVPNLASVILVQASLALSTAILVEASLSFLGLGTPPPTPSLGRMLAEARDFLLLSPWPALVSGLAILWLALGFNLVGDALRDALDPRLRGRE